MKCKTTGWIPSKYKLRDFNTSRIHTESHGVTTKTKRFIQRRHETKIRATPDRNYVSTTGGYNQKNFTWQFPADASKKLHINSFRNFSHELLCTLCNEHTKRQRSTHGSQQKVLMKEWKRSRVQQNAQSRQSIPSVRLHNTQRQVTHFAKAYPPSIRCKRHLHET